MKTALVLILGLLTTSAWADTTCTVDGKDISMQLDQIVSLIKTMPDCNSASDFAGACAFGSSADAQIAGTASDVCGADLKKNKATATDHKLLSEMWNACETKWSGKQGTMYISLAAFCELDAIKWMVRLTDAYNE